MPRKVAAINIPGIQIPTMDVPKSWQYVTFLYYGYEPPTDPFFFWRETTDGDTTVIETEDSSLSTTEVNDDSSSWDNVSSAEFSTVETDNDSTSWTKLGEFYDKSGED